MRTATLAILIYLSIHCVYAWDTEELEIFDLVEEINQNFYNVLGVQQVCLKFKKKIHLKWLNKTLNLLCSIRTHP